MIKHTYIVLLKEFSELFKCLASSSTHTVSRWLDLLFKTLQQKRKRNKRENSHDTYMSTFSYGRSLPIYRLLVCRIFIKTLIIISISTNIHRPYVCDHLGPYISLVNNSIDQIKPYWSTLINYPHQHIDYLINDRFMPIYKLSCQHVVCQTIPRALENMEYIKTPL